MGTIQIGVIDSQQEGKASNKIIKKFFRILINFEVFFIFLVPFFRGN